MRNKFDIRAEVMYLEQTIVCITETWLTSKSPLDIYSIDGYTAYHITEL